MLGLMDFRVFHADIAIEDSRPTTAMADMVEITIKTITPVESPASYDHLSWKTSPLGSKDTTLDIDLGRSCRGVREGK